MQSFAFGVRRKLPSLPGNLVLRFTCLATCALVSFIPLSVQAQQAEMKSQPVVVQPGAPGQPTQKLPSSTRAKLPPLSPKDVEFMQGMVMHHAQAVEMTALINERTTNKELRLLGARISHSQADEMKYMERWLRLRGEPTSMPMSSAPMSSMQHMPGMDMSKHQQHMLMP